ncbi:hypothetical protein HAZT_HAZT004653 [Hyalella azteca]|uniref:Pyroglutamyl-peptidase I n=1 Tax=Hyalella azteca TaxID=294128 RepID=A0A6A0H4D1_HYAAZ|nr:hypothetical protein HAZT_HAZT004653 [Hyalella azteca]
MLVVHVGVAGHASKLTLEEQAGNDGYTCLDIKHTCPQDHCCIPGGKDILMTNLPLKDVARDINQNVSLQLKCELSQDPGKYLCSFVYYTSLNQDASRSIFIHVPPLEVCSAEITAKALAQAIRLLYRTVQVADATTNIRLSS